MSHNSPIVGILLILGMCSLSDIPKAQAPENSLGLPSVPIPAGNRLTPAKVALGQRLFFDKRLSRDGATSCASCHQPQYAFSDGLNISIGTDGQHGSRNTPSLLNVAFSRTLFWDGRRETLEAQALDPFLNPREHGLTNEQALLEILQGDSDYRSEFQKSFPNSTDIKSRYVGEAIASFERTLVSGNSPFDRFAFRGEQSALSTSAKNGLALFTGRARCVSCHKIEGTYALFTDNEFHSLNIGLSRIGSHLADVTRNLVLSSEIGTHLDHLVISNDDIAELGRFAVTLKPQDIGKFRTPSLRNVAETGPYMHDGSISSLREVVELELYYRNTETNRPVILTPVEKGELIEFLKSLSSPPSSLATVTVPGPMN